FYPSFAWAFLKHEHGGAIATIGATRPAYTWVDKDGVYAGAGLLDVRFFSAYEEGVTVGEMLSQAQTDYLNFFGPDVFTIQEFLLLGDPSLRVGGYW
ncbi:MAG: C25 family cysteine peptidase, partial [Candidatus Thermoplasmatota archaeon]|nr:C25 family cysteine peptidase [Candidatus Thermoplasmatota archaeon]